LATRLGHDGPPIKASGRRQERGHRRKSGGARFAATVIRAAFESAGAISVDENKKGPGVGLKKTARLGAGLSSRIGGM
jgi:hypothetical protein